MEPERTEDAMAEIIAIQDQVATKRLFFDDAYLTEFDAGVVGRTVFEGKPAVILDQTAFYPEAGGQSCDRGTINGIAVLQVVEDEEAIVHVLERAIEADAVNGRIDGPRRFDRMQQHSGQHILSQAFYEVVKGATMSFHIGDEVSTLEIGIPKISDAGLDLVEVRANAVVFEDREIKTYFVPEDRIGTIPLRKPPKKEGPIRVVEVSGFDYSACGGTHCRRAGEIGLIKVTKTDRIRNNLRFEFVCGGRALRDYQEKNRTVRQAAAFFSVADSDVAASIEKSLAEIKALKKKAKKLEERIASYEAHDIIHASQGKVIQAVFEDKSPEEVRFLAIQVIRNAERIVLFGAHGETQSHLILAAAEGLGLDVRTLIPAVSAVVQVRGGGSPSLVELVTTEKDKLGPALEAARKFLE
jgi:alanyl-tRNA synthetase